MMPKMEGGRRPDDGQDWRRVQCASPESRSTATDAPEASGLEVTTGSRIVNPRLGCACCIQFEGVTGNHIVRKCMNY
ncbi:Os07g0492500 [Oryza sativa Japonica Group]|uniref:Os07g0492500 protein n=1 Tax=Oryza sativa subsp. japonica TaxID=39947 RepID=A0A0P0X5T5_ORYSJ|nr:Os07g0492500 [Oryza sativa Japonica Group]